MPPHTAAAECLPTAGGLLQAPVRCPPAHCRSDRRFPRHDTPPVTRLCCIKGFGFARNRSIPTPDALHCCSFPCHSFFLSECVRNDEKHVHAASKRTPRPLGDSGARSGKKRRPTGGRAFRHRSARGNRFGKTGCVSASAGVRRAPRGAPDRPAAAAAPPVPRAIRGIEPGSRRAAAEALTGRP